MRNNKKNKRLNSKDFKSMVDILLENAFKVKVKYDIKKDYRE